MTTQWKEGVYYNKGDIVEYNGEYFECRQPHPSQADWYPYSGTLSLWLPIPKPSPPEGEDPPTPPPEGEDPPTPPNEEDPPTPPPEGEDPPEEEDPPTPPSTSTDVILAPYLYIWGYDNSSYKIRNCMDYYNKTGGKVITMAFILADHNQ